MHDQRWRTTTACGLWWLLFLIGLALSLLMVSRTRFDGDQFNMLARGWTLAFAGEWLQYGMPTSAGGMSPGGLQSLLVGLPLMVWADGRAATLLLWLISVVGYLLLDRAFGPALGPRGRLLLALFYWLNPWRMHYTSMLWNSSYMFFFGAVHAFCSVHMRRARRFWPSLVMVLCIGLGLELHIPRRWRWRSRRCCCVGASSGSAGGEWRPAACSSSRRSCTPAGMYGTVFASTSAPWSTAWGGITCVMSMTCASGAIVLITPWHVPTKPSLSPKSLRNVTNTPGA